MKKDMTNGRPAFPFTDEVDAFFLGQLPGDPALKGTRRKGMERTICAEDIRTHAARNELPKELTQGWKVRDRMKECGIIWGVDTAPGSSCTSMFHGMDMLHDLTEGRRAEWFSQQKVMFFSLDFRGDELEYLYAVVQHLHGRCCDNEH